MSKQPQSQSSKRLVRIVALVMLVAGLWYMWSFVFGPMQRRKDIIAKGVHVPGRLLKVEETGATINKSHELELTVELTRSNGALDTATTNFVPKRSSAYMIQPGTPVTAAYDPEKPDEIAIVDFNPSPGNDSSATRR